MPEDDKHKVRADIEEGERLVRQLQEAARQAGVTHDDPMAPLIGAFARAIRYLDRRSSRSDRIAEASVKRILQAVSQSRLTADAETRRFEMRLANARVDVVKYVADEIISRSDAAWSSRVRAINRRSGVILAAIMFFMMALGAVFEQSHWRAGISNLAGFRELLNALIPAPDSAATWLRLMNWNDLTQALASCTPEQIRVQDGRRWCLVPLWIEGPHHPK